MQRLSRIDPIWVILLLSTLLFTPSVSQEGERSGKRRERQIFREDVSPLLEGKVPSFAFDWTRLMFNNLDSRGISMPDGMTFSSDRLQDGRSDEKRLILFRKDKLTPRIPSTYTLRNPVEYPLYPNPYEKPESLVDRNVEAKSFRCSSGYCHYYKYDDGENGNVRGDYEERAKHGVLNSEDITVDDDLRPEPFPREEEEEIPYIKDAEELKSSHYKQPHVLFKKFHRPPAIQALEVHLFSPLANMANMHDYYYHRRMLEQILFQTKTSPQTVSFFVSNSKKTKPKGKAEASWKNVLRDLLHLQNLSK